MKKLLYLSGLLGVSLVGAGLLAEAQPAMAQTVLQINYDTSSFENVELSAGEVGVRVSYTHYQETAEFEENNLTYQLVYQGEKHHEVDTFAWAFAEFELQDLDSDGTDEVIVRNYSGGAHCCTNTTIHRWSGDGFTAVETGFLDGLGGDLADLNGDGYTEIAILDQAFLYQFGSYAESFPPMTFFTYRDGQLAETTREFPEQLREQAKTIKETFLKVRDEEDYFSYSMLAGYVAQEAVLNENFEEAWQFMLDSYADGDGESVRRYPNFPTTLRAFLMETGYLGEDGLPVDDGN